MPEFVEKYNSGSRKRLFKIMDSLNILDIPTGPHLQKSESLDNLEISELHENRFTDGNYLLTQAGEFIQLQKSPHRFLRTQ